MEPTEHGLIIDRKSWDVHVRVRTSRRWWMRSICRVPPGWSHHTWLTRRASCRWIWVTVPRFRTWMTCFLLFCVFFLSMGPHIYGMYAWINKKAQRKLLSCHGGRCISGGEAFSGAHAAAPWPHACPNPIMSSRSRLSAGGGRTALVVHAPSVPVSIISGSRARNVNARRPDTRSRSHTPA
jgi:hypothetical protein